MKLFIPFLVFISIVYMAASCKPDPIPTVEQPKSTKVNWSRHPATNGKQFITNGLYKEADRLTVIGFDYRLYLDTAHQVLQQTYFNRSRNEIDYLNPAAINKTFFAYVQEDNVFSSFFTSVIVRSSANPAMYSLIPVSRFGQYAMIFQYKEPTCLLTDENKLLIPVADTTGGLTGYLLKFQLTMGTDSVEYRLEERIPLPNTATSWRWATGGMLQLGTEDIWANLMETCFKINLRTKVITHSFPLNNGKFGMIRDTLYAFGLDGTLQTISYNYLPKGQTQWQQFKIEGVSGGSMRWYFVENEILAVLDNDKIYHFTVEGNNVRFRRLDSEGVELIKDITYFKGRVYIASLQGLYYKSWKDFWTYTP
jgi:hypothetical protein